MLIGSALKIGEGYKKYPLIVPTLYKSVTFVGLVAVPTVLEEITIGYLHGRAVVDVMANVGGGSRDQRIATSRIGELEGKANAL